MYMEIINKKPLSDETLRKLRLEEPEGGGYACPYYICQARDCLTGCNAFFEWHIVTSLVFHHENKITVNDATIWKYYAEHKRTGFRVQSDTAFIKGNG